MLGPGTIHVAPGRRHIELVAKARVRLFDHLEGAIYAPSHTHLLLSLARIYGAGGCGVILTGLGSDGAAGLLEVRNASGRTLAQTEASCVVAGMPRAAAELGAVQQSLHPERIGRVRVVVAFADHQRAVRPCTAIRCTPLASCSGCSWRSLAARRGSEGQPA